MIDLDHNSTIIMGSIFLRRRLRLFFFLISIWSIVTYAIKAHKKYLESSLDLVVLSYNFIFPTIIIYVY